MSFLLSPMNALSSFARDTFARRQRRLDVFSDVFGNNDFDAIATTDAQSLVTVSRNYVEIRHPLEAAYYFETIADLNRSVRRRIAQELDRAESEDVRPHADLVAAGETFNETTHSIVGNIAPRTGTKQNGNEFFVGITYEGDEYYGVPSDSFTYLTDDLAELYLVPNDAYFGPLEQFRSASVAHRVRVRPEHLQPVFQSEARSAIRRVLGPDDRLPIIPRQHHPVQVAFVDKFGNLRCRAMDLGTALEDIERKVNRDGVVGLRVGRVDEPIVPAYRRQANGKFITCLREVPDGALGLYVNPSEKERGKRSGYIEANVKWMDGTFGRVPSAHETLHKPEPGTPVEFVRL